MGEAWSVKISRKWKYNQAFTKASKNDLKSKHEFPWQVCIKIYHKKVCKFTVLTLVWRQLCLPHFKVNGKKEKMGTKKWSKSTQSNWQKLQSK